MGPSSSLDAADRKICTPDGKRTPIPLSPARSLQNYFGSSDDTGLNDVAGGNYSALTVRFDLAREVGHYIMDYFVPSILLVVVSWVSFWLDPNAVPGRTTLGKH